MNDTDKVTKICEWMRKWKEGEVVLIYWEAHDMRIAMMEMAIGIVLGKPVWFWGTQWAVIQNKLHA